MLYFSYGMNTDPDQMRQFTARPLGSARLLSHTFHFSVHADVRPDFNATVDGVLWLIDDETLASLDNREGYPDYYTRDLQPVNFNGEIVEAWCYAMRSDYRTPSPPSEGYLRMLHRGYEKFHVPTQQIDQALAEFK
jgi:gamma-glutamylcyclotransferase (GGCT)/AIG2-like uncharacterized protein YtfP